MATMEDLTKTQIVLLTLLVSFVTSIATGIITTSLLAEAPASVTQTINRVVEHTIEKVVPAPLATSTQTTVTGTTVKEVTVVKEEDAIINSISKSAASVVRIRQARSSGAGETFYALGVVVSQDGLIVSDKRLKYDRSSWKGVFTNGSTAKLEVVAEDDIANLVLFKIVPEETSGTSTPPRIVPISLADHDPRLGQSVIAIEGLEKNVVAIGRVLGVNTGTETGQDGNAITTVYSVDTDITSNEIAGGPLLNLSGELVGIKTSSDEYLIPTGAYTTLASIKRLIALPR